MYCISCIIRVQLFLCGRLTSEAFDVVCFLFFVKFKLFTYTQFNKQKGKNKTDKSVKGVGEVGIRYPDLKTKNKFPYQNQVEQMEVINFQVI